MKNNHTTLSKNGRVSLPAWFREERKLKPGNRLVWLRDTKGGLRITTFDDEIEAIQAEARKRIPPGYSLVDELLRERRENAKREHGDY